MPYKSSKIKIVGTKHDRRVKLTQRDKQSIKELYKLSEWSTRKLAKKYEVSKRLIQFILDPAKLEANKERRKERGGSKQYYNKEYSTNAKRKHRRYKQKLYISGSICLSTTPK